MAKAGWNWWKVLLAILTSFTGGIGMGMGLWWALLNVMLLVGAGGSLGYGFFAVLLVLIFLAMIFYGWLTIKVIGGKPYKTWMLFILVVSQIIFLFFVYWVEVFSRGVSGSTFI